jgi:hypothetical protein
MFDWVIKGASIRSVLLTSALGAPGYSQFLTTSLNKHTRFSGPLDIEPSCAMPWRTSRLAIRTERDVELRVPADFPELCRVPADETSGLGPRRIFESAGSLFSAVRRGNEMAARTCTGGGNIRFPGPSAQSTRAKSSDNNWDNLQELLA